MTSINISCIEHALEYYIKKLESIEVDSDEILLHGDIESKKSESYVFRKALQNMIMNEDVELLSHLNNNRDLVCDSLTVYSNYLQNRIDYISNYMNGIYVHLSSIENELTECSKLLEEYHCSDYNK